MVTNLAQVNCKVLLKLALDHAPFPDLSVLHSTVVPGTDQGYIHCDNSTLSLDSKKNSKRTLCEPTDHPHSRATFKQSKRYITFPASKAQSGF